MFIIQPGAHDRGLPNMDQIKAHILPGTGTPTHRKVHTSRVARAKGAEGHPMFSNTCPQLSVIDRVR